MSTRVEPVAADARVGVGDDRPDGAIGLEMAAVLGDVALPILVVVEVLLPQVAQLEDPVIARGRSEAQHERLLVRLAPGAKAVMPIGYAAIAQIQRAAETDAV